RVARGRAVESDAVQRRERACPRARRTGRTARDQAEGPEPEVRSDTLVVAVWLCHGVLLAAVTVGLMTMELMLSGRVALAIAAAIPGLVRRRRYTYLWLAFALVGYAGAAAVEVVATSGGSPFAAIALLASLAELGLLFTLSRPARPRPRANRG